VTTYQTATAYWAQRGWDAQAPIKTESRIETVSQTPPEPTEPPATPASR
jgi:hypothetical protein